MKTEFKTLEELLEYAEIAGWKKQLDSMLAKFIDPGSVHIVALEFTLIDEEKRYLEWVKNISVKGTKIFGEMALV
jgi:hypothetical protein